MGGFINDIDTFDSLEFGISKREAEFMDPSLRVTLEVAHQVRYLDCRLNELNFHVIFKKLRRSWTLGSTTEGLILESTLPNS